MTAHVVDRSPRGLVVVQGPDATSYLQSLVSQDLDPIGDGQGAHSLLLTPQGKLDVDFRVLRVGDEWWLDCDAELGRRLAESLTKFRIRVKADIEDRTPATGMLSLIGSVPAGVPATVHAHTDLEGLRAVRTDWAGIEGADLLGAVEHVHETLDRLAPSVEVWTPAAFELFRIEVGRPRYGVDVDEKTIPQEAFLDRDAISFTKGCFLGQELVARIDSRGHVNRYLRRLRAGGSTTPPKGAAVVVDDREVGAVSSAAVSPDGSHVSALAMVRREVEPPADALLRWDGGELPATVLP